MRAVNGRLGAEKFSGADITAVALLTVLEVNIPAPKSLFKSR